MRCNALNKVHINVLRRILYFLTIGLFTIFAFSCKQTTNSQWIPDPDAVLNVYFFHLTDRCDACTAIETNTKTVLNEHFKSQIENGTIKFYSFNINKENKAVTEKYQISYTSLLLVSADGTITDFTNTSFNYANLNPSKFQALLKSEIDKKLE
jgi:hypothetical protein